MSLEELVANYGYTAVAIGTFLEAETILLLGGFAAHRGLLELPWVIVCAFLGSFVGDQAFFYIGRMNGEKNVRDAFALESEIHKSSRHGGQASNMADPRVQIPVRATLSDPVSAGCRKSINRPVLLAQHDRRGGVCRRSGLPGIPSADPKTHGVSLPRA